VARTLLDWPRGARPTPRAPPRRYASLFESDAARALEGAPAHALLDRVAAVEAGSPAWLFFTSGTTGRPKAAVLSHENLRAQSRAFLTDLHAVRPEEAMLHAAPLTHASGSPPRAPRQTLPGRFPDASQTLPRPLPS